MKFCIVDMSNLIHRARHAVGNQYAASRPYDPFGETSHIDSDEVRVGMIFNTVFQGLLNAFQRFDCDHCVAAFDARSWRRDHLDSYKANRRNKERTPSEQHDQELVAGAIDELRDFLKEFTNVTVLYADKAEADDMIARWVQLHDDPSFEHVIVSADGDFKQLVRDGVVLFDPMMTTQRGQRLYTTDGVFYYDGRKAAKGDQIVEIHGQKWKVKIDSKTKEPEKFDPEWELFYKCIRGDESDNISPAWPRVYTSKMRKAYEGGVEEWNNFINATWERGDQKYSVRELYERNRTLIDLRRQPPEVVDEFDMAIADALDTERTRMVGAYFAKFCAKYKLNKLASRADQFTSMLAKSYD